MSSLSRVVRLPTTAGEGWAPRGERSGGWQVLRGVITRLSRRDRHRGAHGAPLGTSSPTECEEQIWGLSNVCCGPPAPRGPLDLLGDRGARAASWPMWKGLRADESPRHQGGATGTHFLVAAQGKGAHGQCLRRGLQRPEPLAPSLAGSGVCVLRAAKNQPSRLAWKWPPGGAGESSC